jgi:hypothetical protein
LKEKSPKDQSSGCGCWKMSKCRLHQKIINVWDIIWYRNIYL